MHTVLRTPGRLECQAGGMRRPPFPFLLPNSNCVWTINVSDFVFGRTWSLGPSFPPPRTNAPSPVSPVSRIIKLPASKSEHHNTFIMDRPGVSANVDFVVLSESHPGCLSPTDPEARGRRRRRDPVPVYTTLHRPQHPAESSTLRGRRRYRSLSCMNNDNNFLSLSASRAASPRAVRHNHHHHHHETTTTVVAEDDVLTKRRVLSTVFLRPENHRRSQSPSRSRSPVPEKSQKKAQAIFSSSSSIAARRRQRTQSRSRPHGQAGLLDTGVLMEASSLRLELVTTNGSAGDQS